VHYCAREYVISNKKKEKGRSSRVRQNPAGKSYRPALRSYLFFFFFFFLVLFYCPRGLSPIIDFTML